MPNKMLIDASHPEETRVVVVRGNRIEEFDFESQDRKQLKGNIYLARVTRVEPSLQAAFVEYGGNRHGFLAFSEIHPDYYQIPVADRQALLRAEAEDAAAEEDEAGEEDDHQDRNRNRRRRRGGKHRGRGNDKNASGSSDEAEASASDEAHDNAETSGDAAVSGENGASADTVPDQPDAPDSEPQSGPKSIAAAIDADTIAEDAPEKPKAKRTRTKKSREAGEAAGDGNGDDAEVESVGAEDALDEAQARRKPVRRHYKIQEVIKRRQILLVQVVKEERGNKGAAITTYLSLAGRYSVLMPNTARGGGISRKITNAQDRKRLKEVVQDLNVPQGMGVILRTAGESRTKTEIKRDYEYLMRLWENVRNLTLESTAPALVYEEGSLIKRSVRDLYNKDIDEILVAGEEGYREAKDFMRMLMPSHAKAVQPYRETTPIFARNGIEAQLDRMLQPQVTLKSGGYIIINQTEALVSIDVNSGRSTKEHSIEDTALQTNLEASEEVARQLRLRDLAGLIVIDFIDMEENRNNRAVEKRLKDCLKNDRARIQVGRISHFGLMEMSRQRIRASVLESTMKPCSTCGGTGYIRSDSSVALLVVRAIEEFLLKESRHHITVRTPAMTALYVLNNKRANLVELETRFGLTITIEVDDTVGAQHYVVSRGALAETPAVAAELQPTQAARAETSEESSEDMADEDAADLESQRATHPSHDERRDDDGNRDRKKRRRRRRRGGGRDRDGDTANGHAQETETAQGATDHEANADAVSAANTDGPEAADSGVEDGERKKRRRGKRGGRKNQTDGGVEAPAQDDAGTQVASDEAPAPEIAASRVETVEPVVIAQEAEAEPAAKPKRAPRRTAKAKKLEAEQITVDEAPQANADKSAVDPGKQADDDDAAEPAKPAKRTRRKSPVKAQEPEAPIVSSTTADDEAPSPKTKKVGWWQRKSFF